MGVDAMVESVDMVKAGTAPRIEQNHDDATYEGWCRAEDVIIDWGKPVGEIYNMIRGSDPSPGAGTTFGETGMRFFRASKADSEVRWHARRSHGNHGRWLPYRRKRRLNLRGQGAAGPRAQGERAGLDRGGGVEVGGQVRGVGINRMYRMRRIFFPLTSDEQCLRPHGRVVYSPPS